MNEIYDELLENLYNFSINYAEIKIISKLDK